MCFFYLIINLKNRKRNRIGKQERLAFRIEAMDLVVDSVQTCNVFSSDHSLPITLVLSYQYRAHIVPTTYNILTTF